MPPLGAIPGGMTAEANINAMAVNPSFQAPQA